MRPGDVVALAVERPAVGGRMIARHDGRIVLVSGAIPGERVRARIERVAKSVAYADTADVDDASPDRRAWDGDPLCGGCLYAHMTYARQLEIKAQVIADAFLRTGRLPLERAVPVASSPEAGYRMRARLHVHAHRAGFFREGTHELCEPAQTRQLLPDTLDVVSRLESAMRSLRLDGIREVEIAENQDASDRVIALDSIEPIAAAALERLASIDGLEGAVWNRTVAGTPFVIDVIQVRGAVLRLRRHVSAFFQGNRYLLSPLAEHVVGQIEGESVVDLYAGGGLFSIAAVEAAGVRVTAVEGDAVSAGDLAANARGRGGVAPVHQAVEAFLDLPSAPRDAGTMIIDPPRTGVSRQAMDGVIRTAPKRVVYVSCDVATLARDARRLVDAGYRLGAVNAFDLFPNTPHVETVATFAR
jgi:tRNA/tmRNA/rRNA uracil-C5-methylase (TrmA/RlmC/RlmD family)